jgi:hypothetical protein
MFAPACNMAGDLPIQKNLDAFTKTIHISEPNKPLVQ